MRVDGGGGGRQPTTRECGRSPPATSVGSLCSLTVKVGGPPGARGGDAAGGCVRRGAARRGGLEGARARPPHIGWRRWVSGAVARAVGATPGGSADADGTPNLTACSCGDGLTRFVRCCGVVVVWCRALYFPPPNCSGLFRLMMRFVTGRVWVGCVCVQEGPPAEDKALQTCVRLLGWYCGGGGVPTARVLRRSPACSAAGSEPGGACAHGARWRPTRWLAATLVEDRGGSRSRSGCVQAVRSDTAVIVSHRCSPSVLAPVDTVPVLFSFVAHALWMGAGVSHARLLLLTPTPFPPLPSYRLKTT